MTRQEEKIYDEAFAWKQVLGSPVGWGIRVQMWIAKKWLLENRSIISDATVFHLQIKNLGLGVCEVAKAPLRICSTRMVKEFLNS